MKWVNPVYPKPNLSKRLKQAQVVPYLLRNAVIDRPNQAWSIDITYIPMKHGFLYLTAIIDWHSRCIVGWELDDTLDTRACIEACEKAYLTEWKNIKEARQAIAAYIHKYNFERCHSAIGNVPPASVYYPAMLYEAAKEAA